MHMKELKCPKCGNVFTVDESDYADIVNQVKTKEFQAEVDRRMKEMEDRQALQQQADSLKAEQQLQAKQLEFTQQLAAKEKELQMMQTQIDYYKDLKTRMSTKMVGETLEQHCSTQFNTTIRTLMPNAYFEKDNDASEGSKGDFIFRDKDDDFEYISVMFEMKNKSDTTATKHKNEDFLKKLDEDRRKKGCEYAVLVSLLEPRVRRLMSPTLRPSSMSLETCSARMSRMLTTVSRMPLPPSISR